MLLLPIFINRFIDNGNNCGLHICKSFLPYKKQEKRQNRESRKKHNTVPTQSQA